MKIKKLAVLGSIMIFGLFSSGTAFSHDCYACAGRHREYTIKEMPEKINSEKIVSFNLKLFEPQRYNFRVENPDYKDKQVLAYVMSLKKRMTVPLMWRQKAETCTVQEETALLSLSDSMPEISDIQNFSSNW